MKYFLRDKKLTKVLNARNELLKKSKEFVKIREDAEKEMMKIGYKLNPLKEKTADILKKNEETIKNGEGLSEFEYVATVSLEKGVPVVEIKDQVEDYKELLREKDNKETEETDASNS